jgi:NAD(P)-dependent dehydrogenase (short-subunit alcohol dehydrogenase family)
MVSEPQDFAGRVALVTGGTQGLGYAVADLLRARGAAGLVLVGRNVEKGEAAAASLTGDSCRAVFVSADLYAAEGCEAAVAAVDDEFGVCHALVNCAAKTDRASVWTATADDWDGMLGLNTRAPALVAQGVARLMVREGVDGSIVFIGSVAAQGGTETLLPYAASKMALIAIARNMAYSLMRHRIRVNVLSPGWMDTPNEDLTQRQWEGASDGWLERAEAEQPWGKLIKPSEIARTIVHLATPESGMLTGQNIEWDQTIMGVGPGVRPGPELGEMPEDLA